MYVPPKQKRHYCDLDSDESNKRKQSWNKTLDTIKSEHNTQSSHVPRHDLQKYHDIRKQILKWIQQSGIKSYKSEDKSYHLKEHEQYTVNVKLNSSNKSTVSIHCALCNKDYKLNEKVSSEPIDKSVFMLFNWTSHIKNR